MDYHGIRAPYFLDAHGEDSVNDDFKTIILLDQRST